MNTNDTNRQKAHAMIDHIFKDLLPAQGMAERSEQIKLSHRMLDTMLNGGIALCDAGTGIGKTYAYLAAAAAANRSDTEALRKPVIISTSSIALQNAVQTEYLPLLSCILLADGQIDRPLLSVIRKGKGHYVCDERLQRRLRQVNFQKKDPAAADALRTLKGTLDMDNVPHLSGYDRERVCVPQFCDCDHQDCRYKRFLKRCDADRYVFQICNHNLLLADAIHRSQGKRPIFPEHSVIIVDEAHKLPEAAREMFGMTLTASDIQSMINQLRAERYLLAADVLTDTMGSLLRKLTQPREETEPLDAYLRLLTIPSRSLLVIEKQVGRLLSAQGRRQLEKLRGTVSLLSSPRTNMILYTADDDDGGTMLCATVSDLTEQMRQVLWRPEHAFVLASGTLAMEAAPQLKASGLDGDYRILADFGGTVLAGAPSKYGVQFVTWDWDYDRTGVVHGHYFMENYAGAKQDFATRSGLIQKEQLFSPEQLTEIYRCCTGSVNEDFFELTDKQVELIRSVQQQIEECVPDLDERIRQQEEALEQVAQEQTM